MFNVSGFREEPENPDHWGFEDKLRPQLIATGSGDVDLRPFTSPRHMQLDTNSCVAQATVKALEIKRIQQHGMASHVDLSRMAVYWMARNMMSPKETDVDKGTFVSLAFDAIRRFGVPPEVAWPWDRAKINDEPSWDAMRKAYVTKIRAYYKIQSQGQDRVDMVVEALRAGNPVVFGTNADRTWQEYQKGQVLKPVSTSDREGRHATVIVGFQGGTFIGENSWGTAWGDDGFYLMSPEVVAFSGSLDFWVPQAGFEEYKA